MAKDLYIGELQECLEDHGGDVNSTAWSPSTKDLFCSCSGDGNIRVWNIGASSSPSSKSAGVAKPSPARSISAHNLYINSCAFNPSGDLFVTASSDETLKLWSTVSWTCVGQLSQHELTVKDCSFSLDGNLLASVSDDTTVKVWEVGALRCISTITKNQDEVSCCRFAPNGWLLATGSTSGLFFLFDVFTGACMARKRLGPAAHDGTIHAIAVQALQQLPAPAATPTQGQAQGQGKGQGGKEVFQFATAGNDCRVKLWKVECDGVHTGKTPLIETVSGSMQAELTQHTGPVYSCAYHPYLPYLATGSRDKNIILWNTVEFTVMHQLAAHTRYVTHVSFAPSGLHLATGSNDRSVKVWELTSTADLRRTGHAGAGVGERSTSASKPEQPSVISGAKWSVDEVCEWAESVAKQQNVGGGGTHPDDIRAASRLIGALEQISTCSDSRRRSVDDDFKCPITTEVMRDPVVASDGYSYERTAITEWLSKGRRTSPVTNLPLPSTLLLPNRALKIAIDKEKLAK